MAWPELSPFYTENPLESFPEKEISEMLLLEALAFPDGKGSMQQSAPKPHSLPAGGIWERKAKVRNL